MRQTDGPNEGTMVGTVSIFSQPACVLFDTGTSLSNMSNVFPNKCGVPVDMSAAVKSPLGISEFTSKMCRNVDIVVVNR